MSIKLIQENKHTYFAAGNRKVVSIEPVQGCEDVFECIEEGAYRWVRIASSPVDHMRMEALLMQKATFTMIPSISYNSNGWGNIAEYVGDRCDGIPWTFAWHRSTIPSCTYSENSLVSLSLMADVGANTACSLYKVDEGEKHVIIYPEEEQPKTLQRHFWGEPFQGTMEPSTHFEAILLIKESDGSSYRYKDLLDFAWRYYGHSIKAPMKCEELYRLSLAYCRFLYEEEQNGFAGFTMGSQWHLEDTSYHKTTHRYEVGWVGQSASMANAYIDNYIRHHSKDDLDTAIKVHDSWLKYGRFEPGHIAAKIDYHPWRYQTFDENFVPDRWKLGEAQYESQLGFAGKKFRRDENGQIMLQHDACNIGTAAEEYLEAYHLLKQINIDKPQYRQCAIDICDFALQQQDERGCFAKSWDEQGNILAKNGTIGCFLVLGLIQVYKETGQQKYLDSAIKAFDYYYSALLKDGFTTAGALDTYSIDKESASPLLRDALALHEVTGQRNYIAAAEKIAWYLCTWMMHYSITYPSDSVLGQMGYDTFGSTSVSTPHQALDQYALRDVLSFIELSKLTGNEQWLERAKAFWCNANQCISDGTLVINHRLRPAGSQDEAIFHTRWARKAIGPFMPSQWLPAWPIAFRLETLRRFDDWALLDEGLKEIKNHI